MVDLVKGPDENIIMLGLFLLVLAVSGNFLSETLSCQSQKLLTDNMIAKQMIIVLVIYFAIILTSARGLHPGKALAYAVAIWAGYIMFT